MEDKKILSLTTPPVNDVYLVWDGTRCVFTLRKISQITGMIIPEELTKDLDTPIAELGINVLRNGAKSRDDGLQVLFIYDYYKSKEELHKNYIEKGVIIVSHVLLKDENGKPYPMIMLESKMEVRFAILAIGKYIKSMFPIPTVGVTGSIGKTTLTRFLECIFAERYSVFSSGERNTWASIPRYLIQHYGPEYTFHVQECGGGIPSAVERLADMISADAFCITNILPQHLDNYKTIENILYDKTGFDRIPEKKCFGVINIDDDRLRNYKFNNRIITCGIEHTEADYVAKNIRQNGMHLEFDIIYKEGETLHTVPVKINIPGVHNANGAVMAFAMAKGWGLTDEEIQSGFLKYKSGAFRQALQEVSGRLIYIDCVSVAEENIRSCLKTLDDFPIQKGNRKIAILGGSPRLGDKAFSANYSLGLTLTDYHTDEYIIIGVPEPGTAKQYNEIGHSYALYQGIKRALRGQEKVSFYSELESVAEKLVKETKPGDIILLKANHRLTLVSILDRAFGTSYTLRFDIPHPPVNVQEGAYFAKYFPDTDSCNIYKCNIINKTVQIPDSVADHPVWRIGGAVFTNQPDIYEIDFGLSCSNIGAKCFLGCTGITSLKIPRNILHIEKDAFEGCTSLESIIIHGAEHIEAGAFRNCRNLKHIVLPENCYTIEAGVFDGCPDVTITAPKNSLGAFYAKENGLKLNEI